MVQTLSANDLERRAGMRRMKRLALGLLVFVTIVFLVARALEDDHSWVGYIRAFAEAAMIGVLTQRNSFSLKNRWMAMASV